jgi:hypothetical protein
VNKPLIPLAIAFFGFCASAAGDGFLFTTFRDEATPLSEQIYMGTSEDGRHWDALNGGAPVLVSDVGEKGVRDSFLIRSHDGRKVWLIATDLCIARNRDWHRATHAGSRSIVIWETTDLVHWSAARLALVAPTDAGCAWAPEATYDEDSTNYLVCWASTTARDNFSKLRIWAARTTDFRSFDAPFIYDEKPNHVIDIHFVHDGGAYYRFTKDDKDKSVHMETSQKLMGPWHEMPQFTAGQGKNFEGPICFRLHSGSDGQPSLWCLLLDNVSDRIVSGAFGYPAPPPPKRATPSFADFLIRAKVQPPPLPDTPVQPKAPATSWGSLFAGLPPILRPRIFVSYQHSSDQYYYNLFSQTFHNAYETVYDNSLRDKIDSQDNDYIIQRIRDEFITGTSCTIVLIGPTSYQRKYLDWEIKATLDKEHGLIGLQLPNVLPDYRGMVKVPSRLNANITSGYALWHGLTWQQLTTNPALLKQHIADACSRPKHRIVNPKDIKKQNG